MLDTELFFYTRVWLFNNFVYVQNIRYITCLFLEQILEFFVQLQE